MRTWTILLLLMFSLPVSAQGDCGDGLPCGPIPWAIPLLPPLQSPTAISEEVSPGDGLIVDTPTPTLTITPTPTLTRTPTNTPTQSATPEGTSTPLPTATAFFDDESIGDQIATLDAFVQEPNQVVMDSSGNALTIEDLFGNFLGTDELEGTSSIEDSETLFSYIKGLNTSVFGPFTPLVGIITFSFLMSWILGGLKFAIPLVAGIFGVIKRLIEFIINIIKGLLSFIPGLG